MSEYTKQAEDFLTKYGLEFRAVLVGDDCPQYCEDALADRDMDKINVFPRKTHIHGKHYRCTVSGAGRGHVSFDFWNSYSDEEYNALGCKAYRMGETVFKYSDRRIINGSRQCTPVAYDLLACIQKSDVDTFENFCAEFGYDTDSRRAFDTFEAVQKEWRKIQKFFKVEEIEALQEMA